jgi:hypothetical protein
MSAATITIPDGVRFSDLRLTRDPDGQVSFDWAPVELICAASGLDIEIFRAGPEDNVAGLLVAWYAAAREAGEPPDPVQDDLITETLLENAYGGGISHPPGRA